MWPALSHWSQSHCHTAKTPDQAIDLDSALVMRCAVNIWGLRSRTVFCPWILASDDPIFWVDGTCRENTKETPVTRCAPGWDNILKSFSFYHLLCVSLNGLYKPPHSEWVHQFSYEHWAGASVMVIVKQWQDGLVISRAGRLQLNKEHQQMWCHPFLFGTAQIFSEYIFLLFLVFKRESNDREGL